jgi:hypothetical protein
MAESEEYFYAGARKQLYIIPITGSVNIRDDIVIISNKIVTIKIISDSKAQL